LLDPFLLFNIRKFDQITSLGLVAFHFFSPYFCVFFFFVPPVQFNYISPFTSIIYFFNLILLHQTPFSLFHFSFRATEYLRLSSRGKPRETQKTWPALSTSAKAGLKNRIRTARAGEHKLHEFYCTSNTSFRHSNSCQILSDCLFV